MKKRIFSGLLAAMMLFTSAFAAGGEAMPAAGEQPSAGAQQTGAALRFAVTLPEGETALSDSLAAALRAVLEGRLAQLGLEQAAVTIDGETHTVTVALPDGAEAAGVAAFLAQPNALQLADRDGGIWLTGDGIAAAEADLGQDGSYSLTLFWTEEGGKTLAEHAGPEDAVLYLLLDGEQAGQTTVKAAQNESCTLEDDFTEGEAKLLAARIMAGELPAALTLTDEELPEPVQPAFPDIAGHWAYDALQRGAELGILNGIDGKMMPDNPIKRSEAVVMLNRVLGAQLADDTSGLTSVTPSLWFAEDLGKAIHLGLIPADDDRNFDTAASRAEAFVLMARAFGFSGAEGDSDVLTAFTDLSSMTAEQRQAAAALVQAGVVNGITDTTLSPQGKLTRAQFVTMFMRIANQIITAPAEDEPAPEVSTLEQNTLLRLAQIELSELAGDGDLLFPVVTEKAQLNGVTLTGRVVLKGMEDIDFTAKNGTQLGAIIADPAGAADISLTDTTAVHTLVIAGMGGAVSMKGDVTNIEITASGRTIDLSDMDAERLVITGSNNTIKMDGTAGEVVVSGGAKNNVLTLNRAVDSLTVAGIGTRVDGSGRAKSVDIRAVDCEVSISADAKTENIDRGLTGVTVDITVPDKVPAGGSLATEVRFTGVEEDKVCTAQWYQDGKALSGYRNDQFSLTADTVSRQTTTFKFTKNMKTTVTVGFKLIYQNPSTGETEEVYAEKTVPIENYSDEWYYQRDVNRVLKLVSSTYRGNYTTAYAVNNDYKPYEKEVWVNAKGYSSRSQYLLWINRAYQHVNVFQGSKGNWKLIKSFLVGTGAAGTPTPTGLTTVSYKSAGGWTTGTYTVRPVVGFYPGTGYAFHSRLCYPGTDKEYDFSAGYPVSHGCIRMYKNDVKWIYNNVPVGTTVVIH